MNNEEKHEHCEPMPENEESPLAPINEAIETLSRPNESALRELLNNIAEAQRHFDGMCADGKIYRQCKEAEELGLCEYLGEFEVCDGDGFMIGENAAAFGLTTAGRTFLSKNTK